MKTIYEQQRYFFSEQSNQQNFKPSINVFYQVFIVSGVATQSEAPPESLDWVILKKILVREETGFRNNSVNR